MRGVLHHCVIVYCVFVSLCLYVLVILCLFISPREPAYKQSLSKYRLSLSVDRLCRLHQQILHQQTAVLGVRVASPRSFCTTGPKENSLRAFVVTDDGCHRDLTLPLSLSPYLDLNIAISISVSVYLCLSQRAFAVTDDGCHRDLTLPLSLSLSLYLNIDICIPVSVSVSVSRSELSL